LRQRWLSEGKSLADVLIDAQVSAQSSIGHRGPRGPTQEDATMTVAEFDEAKMQSYRLSDEEVDRLNALIKSFVASVEREFGSRMRQAMFNMIGSMLAHKIAAYDVDGFYAMECINDWFRVVALNHGGLPLCIKFDDELVEEMRRKRQSKP
jgi:hypothetical protein